ncbi:MAG: sulfotransferase family protein [Syntrophobacteria bacterium]
MYFHYPTLFKGLRLTFSRRYFSPRHACLVAVFVSLFLLLRTFVWVVRLLDPVLFPGYRKQCIRAPVYIIGNPRSGTTFTHRLVCLDQQFSYLKLYHTVFPAVSFYKFFAVAARLDYGLGSPFARALNRISRRGFRGWETIHKTGPQKAESDEMLFVYAMLSPLLGLLLPFLGELEQATFVDKLPAAKRSKLMEYYRDCLQRHMFATGPDKTLLQKVALIAGRLGSILEVFPDMRIVHLIRHPYESVPSLISMFCAPWRTLAPQVKQDSQASRGVAKMIFAYYRYVLQLKRSLPENQFIEVRYQDLVRDPKGTVAWIYEKLNLEMADEYRKALEDESETARHYKSRHTYSLEDFGLTREMVYEELHEVFEEYDFKK